MTNVDNDGIGLDDGLDAEDVAEAMKQRAHEEWISSGHVQGAYYNSWCYMRDIEQAGVELEDERLRELAAEALNTLQHVNDHLHDTYQNWEVKRYQTLDSQGTN